MSFPFFSRKPLQATSNDGRQQHSTPSSSSSSSATSSSTIAMPPPPESPIAPQSRFRVIIVGGGPAGLGMAHALSLAGVDYVLLERRKEVVHQDGASIALWPHSVRIMDQFGLLEQARKLYKPIKSKYNLRPDGSLRDKNDMFEAVEKNHGHPWMLFRRTELLELLYNSIPDKEKHIHTDAHVTRIDMDVNSVRVFCRDGVSHDGSIVIGCDGVHSSVRRIMREMMLLSHKRVEDSEMPMKTYYNGLIGYLPMIEGLVPGCVYEVRGERQSFHVLTGIDDAYFFVYNCLEQTHQDGQRYTDVDAEALAQTVLDHPITKELKFRNLWEAKTWSKMIDYQEGFLKKWYYGRIVLVGDSVHKTTPNAGLSLNTGWQGMVELTNRLHALLRKHPSPDLKRLTSVFKNYQKTREKIAKETMQFSGLYTRIVAWQNPLYKIADLLAPRIGGDIVLLDHLVSPIVRKSIVLDFVEEKERKEGKIPWRNGGPLRKALKMEATSS